jgi:hypothetical protein
MTMRFLNIIKSVERKLGPPPPALMQAIAALGTEKARAGVLVDTGGLAPTTAGALIRVCGGKLTVTEGPLAEGQEAIGGYAIFEVASKAEAIALARQFMQLHAEHWPEWEGAAEVRPVFGPPKAG